MENNNWNWYENATPNVGNNTQQPAGNNFSGNYGESGNQGSRGKKERKHVATWTQLIICMLVMALIGGGVGAGAVYFATRGQNNQQALNNAGSTVVTPPDATGGPAENSAGTGSGNGPSASPSSGINMSSGSSTTSTGDTGSIIRTCMSSVVGIDIEQEVSNGYAMFGYGQSESGATSETVGSGSGVIVTSDGYIVTNNHVVARTP